MHRENMQTSNIKVLTGRQTHTGVVRQQYWPLHQRAAYQWGLLWGSRNHAEMFFFSWATDIKISEMFNFQHFVIFWNYLWPNIWLKKNCIKYKSINFDKKITMWTLCIWKSKGLLGNVACDVFVLQEGEGKMAPPSSPSQSTQASVKCQRRISSM